MNYKSTLILLPAFALAACGGGQEQTLNQPAQPGSVIYSFPADGQTEVSPKADIVLRFSHAITDEDVISKIRLSNGESNLGYSLTAIDGGRSLKLTPTAGLSVGSSYTVEFTAPLAAEGGRTVANPNAEGAAGIQFDTRAAFTGIAGLDNLATSFDVVDMVPSANGFFRPMDFSTFRLRLSQPVDPGSVRYGETLALTDSSGELVPANVLAKGRYLTIDPCTTALPADCGLADDQLQAGETYTLAISGIRNLQGQILNFEETFTPKETGPTVILFQETIDSGLKAGASQEEARKSILNGQIINGVTLNSVLQGKAGPSQKTGDLYAELAYTPSFPGDEPAPLRVPRNSVLMSTSLDVKINGSVPIINEETGSIQQTGNIVVTMLSDATGYLYPNPYSDSGEAPRHVKLFMDVAMNTEEAQPNAALSQDLLHVELSGIAIVKDGVLTIDAIGMVEPNLLGQEVTDSTIAFRIEADTNLDTQLQALENREADTSGPTLVSWMPGNEASRQASHRPGDPIVLNLDEPLDSNTLANLTLVNSSGDVPFSVHLDGTTIAVNATGGFQHNETYTLTVPATVTDLAGNGYVGPQTFVLELPTLADQGASSPLAVTTYPGFPCATVERDLSQDLHGRCAGLADNAGDEAMPVQPMPADRPIVVVFSQSMDLDSINADTLKVEKVLNFADPNSDTDDQVEAVSGRLEKNLQRIRFYPEEAWEAGQLYRYTLSSQPTTTPSCGTEAICSEAGQALETNALAGLSNRGGPDMVIYFKGSEAQQSVFNPLRNLPVRDVSAEGINNCAAAITNDDGVILSYQDNCLEPFDHEEASSAPTKPGEQDRYLPSPQSTQILGVSASGTATSYVSVGCDQGEICPQKPFIYQTGGLNTEIVGPVDPSNPDAGVRVMLYPTLLTTTSADVYSNSGNTPTGKQIIRMRYAKDDPACTDSCQRSRLIPGVIRSNDNGEPIFEADVELYLDAPELNPQIFGASLSHNQHSYPITLDLSGPVRFLDDGRTVIEQRNQSAVPIAVEIRGALVSVDINLEIPAGGTLLQFLSNPIKDLAAPTP